jgi:cyclopropane fatty-acyl-phospholipid synthase-like methyltransferase
MIGSRPPSHFAKLYQSNPDPWGFRTDQYEQEKYRHSIEVLEGQHFAGGLEVGCSIGVLTQMLAPLCENLLALDIVDQPLKAAAKRCANQPGVQFQRMQVPDEWPDQRFDLIVLSEVLYFLSPADIDRCARRVNDSLLPGARVLLVNWLGQSDDPCSGDQAADRFMSATAGTLTVSRQDRHAQDRRAGYRLDLLAAM